MISRILRFGLLFALVFGLVWLGVIIWWQESNRAVSGRDVILWMGLLPMVLIGVFFLLRTGFRWATAAPTLAAAAEPDAAAPAQSRLFAAAERGYHLAVIASGWAGSAGDSADQAAPALKAGEIEPVLDSKVRDGDGLPSLVAKHPALELESAQSWLESSALGRGEGSEWEQLKPRLLRCLALLELALPPALAPLAELFPQPEDPHEPRPATPRVLRLAVLEPVDFSDAAMTAIEAFIGAQISAADWGPVSVEITRLPTQTGLPLLRWLDAAVIAGNRDALSDVVLLVAVDSSLDEQTLQALSARDQLYAAKRPAGQIPGEAAAVLALTTTAAKPTSMTAYARLHRIAAGLRDKPVDVRGRISDAMLGELSGQALMAAKVDASTCLAVFSDGGPSVPRIEELALTMTRLLPDLDVVADRVDLASALGDLGAARIPSLLALAAAQCMAEQKPVMVAGIADTRERFAVLITAAEPVTPAG